jgi:hypothetical protein
LRKNPRTALTIDTQDQWPPRALLIRGAQVELVDGLPDAYIELDAATVGEAHCEHRPWRGSPGWLLPDLRRPPRR